MVEHNPPPSADSARAPADLILTHTSDQPLQVKENIHLFIRALVEAIILVVIIALLGFWEWRLALIMALAIPITLAMTFGIVYVLGIDLQQVSIATLIIALGLLVDVPVVSGDGIKRHCYCGPPQPSARIFGFMAFLGIASLIGVIVSHVIVLFDFIEEMHAKGEPLVQALADAGIQRIRPVMITVGATILALFPLALEGGPLWQPLCYAQIGGLGVAPLSLCSWCRSFTAYSCST